MSSISPVLARVIRQAIAQAMKTFHVGLPAKVVDFDASKRTCNVQPLLKRVILTPEFEEQEISYPQISGVPVWYPGGNGFHMRWPLKFGDIVFLIFADRSLETWKKAEEGKEVDPVEDRAHDLKDAVAMAVLRPPSSEHPEVRDTFVIGNEDGSVEIELDTNHLRMRAPNIDISADGEADDFMVLGNKILQKLQKLESTLKGHTHPHPQGETAVSAALASPIFDTSILSQKARLK
jgi:hypothetical protein